MRDSRWRRAACLADWNPRSGELTFWDSTQAPISIRGGLASLFGLEEDKVRVIAPDTGRRLRNQKVLLFHPDELLVPMAAMRLGRPVKYIEDRGENFIGSSPRAHARYTTIQLAARRRRRR